jgi:uncharacterized BrkB/YihY/UPF0761 family membrane protein
MVRHQAGTGRNVTDRRAGRGRLFLGSVLLLGAVAACLTGLFTNPTVEGARSGIEHVRASVVIFMRNSAIATLVLVALASVLLFPRPRLRHPLRDRLMMGVAAALAAFSVYRLVWLQSLGG